MSTPRYSTDQLHAVTKLVGDLALAQGGHDLALSALLGAYATIAAAHPCCTSECAYITRHLSGILTEIDAARAATKH